jgi:E3 ubiquitin-protein ligase TRIP12
MKKELNKEENPNDYLPTVMTCQNFLKIPDYTDIYLLKEKLYLAMNEGANAFHLS